MSDLESLAAVGAESLPESVTNGTDGTYEDAMVAPLTLAEPQAEPNPQPLPETGRGEEAMSGTNDDALVAPLTLAEPQAGPNPPAPFPKQEGGETEERVQISVAICAGKEYCLEFLREAVAELRAGADCETSVMLVNDRCEIPQGWLPSGWTVVQPAPVPEDALWMGHSASLCVRSRIVQREMFLAGNFGRLFLLDCDQIPPADAIVRLLKLGADAATGLVNTRGCKELALPSGDKFAACLLCSDPVCDNVFKVSCFNQGCMLISRAAVEAVPWRSPEELGETLAWEDMSWCRDLAAWQRGGSRPIGIMLDLGASCWHADADGTANHVLVGDPEFGACWTDLPHFVRNRYGEWARFVPRYDLAPDEAKMLPPGFVHGIFPKLTVETLPTNAATCELSRAAQGI